MTSPWLTVICAAIGRPSTERLLDSIRSQMSAADVEILLVGDTHADTFRAALDESVPGLAHEYHALYVQHDAGFHHYGHPQAQYGMDLARGRWLMFVGDDDEYLPGAFDAIRKAIGEYGTPGPMLFRGDFRRWDRLIWGERRLAMGDISAQNICTPNTADKLGVWSTEIYQGDYAFIESTADAWGGPLALRWRDEVIVRCH